MPILQWRRPRDPVMNLAFNSYDIACCDVQHHYIARIHARKQTVEYGFDEYKRRRWGNVWGNELKRWQNDVARRGAIDYRTIRENRGTWGHKSSFRIPETSDEAKEQDENKDFVAPVPLRGPERSREWDDEVGPFDHKPRSPHQTRGGSYMDIIIHALLTTSLEAQTATSNSRMIPTTRAHPTHTCMRENNGHPLHTTTTPASHALCGRSIRYEEG